MKENREKDGSETFFIYTVTDFPYGAAGENLIRQMALGLKESGVHVVVVRMRGKQYGKTNDTGIECQNLLFAKRPTNEFVKMIELIGIIIMIPVSILRNRFTFKTKAILLLADYYYLTLPFRVMTLLLGIKLARIVTDLYETSTIAPAWWKKPKIFFYNWQFKKLDKYLNGIICVSGYLKQRIMKNGVPEQQILLVPSFIDITHFLIPAELRLKRTTAKSIIGFCGTANEFNGIIHLAEAFKLLLERDENVELKIIGEPQDDIRKRITEIFGDNTDKCKFTGFLDKDSVARELNRCDILVNPRKSSGPANAGFPTKLGEYFASRKAVVSTMTGDLGNYFTDKKELVLVKPDDSKALSEGILYLLRHEKESQKIARHGYEWAVRNLDYKSNGQKLRDFINSV